MATDDHDFVGLFRAGNFRDGVVDGDRLAAEGGGDVDLRLHGTGIEETPDHRGVLSGHVRDRHRSLRVFPGCTAHIEEAVHFFGSEQDGSYLFLLKEFHFRLDKPEAAAKLVQRSYFWM